AVAVAHLRAQPVHVVVVAGDGEDGRVEDGRPEQLARLEVVGDEHAALDAEARGMRCDAVREVAGGRAGEHLEPELQRAGRRHRHDAVLVGQRRVIHRVVLDIELARAKPLRQAIAAHQRRVAGVEAGARLAGDRQELTVAPQVLRPALDFLARQVNRAVVVHRLERAQALVANVGRLSRERGLTEMTLQSNQGAHTASAKGRNVLASSKVEAPSSKSELNTGAGTIAARSRAMALMSLMMATAVALPPAPVPQMTVSPEC